MHSSVLQCTYTLTFVHIEPRTITQTLKGKGAQILSWGGGAEFDKHFLKIIKVFHFKENIYTTTL